MTAESEEILPVVDENDVAVGTARRAAIHEQKLRHRSVHVLVFNSAGEILVQLRGPTKDQYPLYWDVSVGGHVNPGESYEAAARRELHEELGLTDELRFVRKTAASSETGWEFTCLYEVTTDRTPRPNAGEIVRVEFVEPHRLPAEIRANRRRATPVLARILEFYLGKETALRGQQPGQE
jgi:16S rRNA (adenine1518-N6/adenine1519-N6)-dimethyltransferase